MPYYTGKYASITIDGVHYPLDKWTLSFNTASIESTNFKSKFESTGFKEFVSGRTSCDITASGFIHSDISTTNFNNPAVFRLRLASGGFHFTVKAVIENTSYDVDLRGPTRFNVTARSIGIVEINT